jgi:hypothetical protein
MRSKSQCDLKVDVTEKSSQTSKRSRRPALSAAKPATPAGQLGSLLVQDEIYGTSNKRGTKK